MKWDKFIKSYQTFTLGGTIMKQFVLQSCFCYVLLRHTNIMTDKGFYIFDEFTTRCVHLFSQEKECSSSSWGDSKMYTSSSIANSQRMQTEINESGFIAKIRIQVENDAVILKTFRIIYREMKISLLILSWYVLVVCIFRELVHSIQVSCFEK